MQSLIDETLPQVRGGPVVCAAVVAYAPHIDLLSRVLAAIAPQVAEVFVVANDGGAWSCPLPPNTTLLKQDRNIGLGGAYNVAARLARDRGFRYLLLLDQDSVASAGMVSLLLEAFSMTKEIAATGPLWRDSRTGEDGFFLRLSPWGMRKHRSSAEVVSVDFLISSGSLISLAALSDIGPFDETLFIEHVDTEWSLRAQAKGYQLYGVTGARLDHAFGDAVLVPSRLGLGHRFVLYPPERNYYLVRNSIVLWRRSYTGWRWILGDIRRTVLLALMYTLCVPPRLERLHSILRGVHDGMSMK